MIKEVPLAAAINVVAHRVMYDAVRHAIDTYRLDWGDYPDLSRVDWDAVLDKLAELVKWGVHDGQGDYEDAYALLAKRSQPIRDWERAALEALKEEWHV